MRRAYVNFYPGGGNAEQYIHVVPFCVAGGCCKIARVVAVKLLAMILISMLFLAAGSSQKQPSSGVKPPSASVVASSPSALATWRRPAAPRVPRFYLHGEGALDFRHEISAILRLAAVAVDELVVRRQFEGKQFDGKWQHAADVFVVQHLCVSHNLVLFHTAC